MWAQEGGLADRDILKEAKEAFDLSVEHESDNRANYEDDIDFALMENQWPEAIRKERELEGRPCLTINKLPPFIRQVVNEARQNKPGINVHPVDDGSDPETADIYNGLIRNIEQSSDAEVAYDTGLECAVAGGFGYWRVNTAYAADDTFDQDIVIQRIGNPLTVYGDCYSTAADSSDWNYAFVTDMLSKDQFERRYKGAEASNWEDEYANVDAPWLDGDNVMIAEYWVRDEVTKKLLALSDGSVVDEETFAANAKMFQALGVEVVGQPRDAKSHKVTQRIMSGAEVLDTVDWVGKFIPIVPVYGAEVNYKGKRHFRSMIRGAKDAQRMFNYWRTTSTELVALAPKAPYIGRKGAFESDAAKWATANSVTHPFMEYDGSEMPIRQPFAGIPAGALQEALNASDDMKAIVGLYDPSLGARSNETSGTAIRARQQEGDVSTFHFIDNLSRAIRHTGRIIIDLIPKVYSTPRVLRVIGPDGKQDMAKVNQPVQQPVMGPNGQPQVDPQTGQIAKVEKIFDLTAGKYDLTVKAGPSFASQREAFVAAATDLSRAVPQLAPILAKPILESFDLPGGEDLLEELEANKGPPPEQVKKAFGEMQQKLQQAGQQNQELQGQLQQAQNDAAGKQMDAAVKAEELRLKGRELEIKDRELGVKEYEAETSRIQAENAPQLELQKTLAKASQAAE